jgi:hypothetical protein
VSRGHRSVPVCEGNAFRDGVACEHGSRGHGLRLSREECVCDSRVLQEYAEGMSQATGPRTVP